VCGSSLVAMGDVFVPFLPRRLAGTWLILGLLFVWIALIGTLITLS
jgi:hypothetical protein